MRFNFNENQRINERFSTVERNIRNESNSFYDAFLDLVETLLKIMADEEEINYKSKTAGDILQDKSFVSFCETKLSFNDVGKLKDYIQKCNKHKHEKEKTIDVDRVIVFLKEFFDLYNAYSRYKKYPTIEFDPLYFHQIYGQTKRDNINLNNKIRSLKKELFDAYNKHKLSEDDTLRMKEIIDYKEDALLTLEEKNRLLENKLDELKDIKINSMEIKLNQALDMLLELKESIAINKTLSNAVGHSIMGDDFDEFVKDEVTKNGK